MSVPSSTNEEAILWKDCRIAGPAESGHITVHPDNPNIVFAGAMGSSPGGGGNLTRYDHSTGQTRMITVWPENLGMVPGKDNKYRFQFHFPTFLSPHDPGVLYVAANVVFRSTDEGTSWTVISPDLTTNDVSKMSEVPGGPITTQTAVPFNMGSILALAESTLKQSLLWAGSDDGLVHISKDNGANWSNVTPQDLPPWALISAIDPSPHDPGAAYLSATRYKQDDTEPYLYKTHDYGQTWVRITDGIPKNDFTRIIREDPAKEGLLYAGTETGVYVSLDGGSNWQPLNLNLPRVPVHDLVVKDNDLVIATHGRALWILDDLTPLHRLKDGIPSDSGFLFKPRPTHRIALPLSFPYHPGDGKNYRMVKGEIVPFYENQSPTGEMLYTYLNAGTNPPRGVSVTYVLNERPKEEVKLAFQDSRGETIKQFSSSAGKGQRAPTEPGMNRFIWDMRYPDAEGPTNMEGPIAPPGDYRVQLTIGDTSHSEPFQIVKDPRINASQEDLESQFQLLIRVRDTIQETNAAVAQVREVRRRIEEWEISSAQTAELSNAAFGIKNNLSSIEAELVPILGSNPQKPPPTRLGPKLASLSEVIASADYLPTRQSFEVFDQLLEGVRQQLDRIDQIIRKDIPTLENLK